MHDILINWAPQETRVAVIENGAVQELHIERALERGLVGNIYMGRVARVLPGMQSAFVDIGLERAAFLHVADVHVAGAPPRSDSGNTPPTPIERLVFEGQALMVQVIKDAIGTKGARLSTQVSIAGRMLVFLPHDNHIGISQKIGSPELREQLRARVTTLASAGLTAEQQRLVWITYQQFAKQGASLDDLLKGAGVDRARWDRAKGEWEARMARDTTDKQPAGPPPG